MIIEEVDKLKNRIITLINEMDNMSDVKKVFKVNDIRGALADELLVSWKSHKKNATIVAESTYPGTKLTTENKVIEETPVTKAVEVIETPVEAIVETVEEVPVLFENVAEELLVDEVESITKIRWNK
jgi:uncharacterized membrane protein YheB (UPF0754 family)